MILLDRLKSASESAQKGHFQKLLSRPMSFIKPALLKHRSKTVIIDARTFFDRKMKIVIPEPISVRIWRYSIFESDVAFYLLHSLRENDTFIDIGGHFGFFSMLACEIVGEKGHVVTFEPMPNTREILTHNLKTHAVKAKKTIIPAAAGDTPGRLTFQNFGLVGSAFATSGSVRNAGYNAQESVDVEVVTVDSIVKELNLSSCRLMKIDAENAEMQVVLGALEMLKSHRPYIILETGDDTAGEHLSKPVVEMVVALGYEAFEFENWALKPHRITESYAYQNLLLIPKTDH